MAGLNRMLVIIQWFLVFLSLASFHYVRISSPISKIVCILKSQVWGIMQ